MKQLIVGLLITPLIQESQNTLLVLIRPHSMQYPPGIEKCFFFFFFLFNIEELETQRLNDLTVIM